MIEDKISTALMVIFGRFSKTVVNELKKELNLGNNITYEEYLKLIDRIHKICIKSVGENYAEKVYKSLLKILDENFQKGDRNE